MKRKFLNLATIISLFACVSCSNTVCSEENKEITVIPAPQEMTITSDCFTLINNSSIALDVSNEELKGIAEYLNEKIARQWVFNFQLGIKEKFSLN